MDETAVVRADPGPAVVDPAHAVPSGAEAALHELSTLLWRERGLLEILLYKLEVQELMLTSSRTHWLRLAAEEVDAVIDEVRSLEQRRAELCAAIGPAAGLGDEPSIRELMDALGHPWGELLAQHHAVFLDLTDRIQEAQRRNRDLLVRGHRATQDLMASLSGGAEDLGYSASGTRTTYAAARRSLLDRTF